MTEGGGPQGPSRGGAPRTQLRVSSGSKYAALCFCNTKVQQHRDGQNGARVFKGSCRARAPAIGGHTQPHGRHGTQRSTGCGAASLRLWAGVGGRVLKVGSGLQGVLLVPGGSLQNPASLYLRCAASLSFKSVILG